MKLYEKLWKYQSIILDIRNEIKDVMKSDLCTPEDRSEVETAFDILQGQLERAAWACRLSTYNKMGLKALQEALVGKTVEAQSRYMGGLGPLVDFLIESVHLFREDLLYINSPCRVYPRWQLEELATEGRANGEWRAGEQKNLRIKEE